MATGYFKRTDVIQAASRRIKNHEESTERNREELIAQEMAPRSWPKAWILGRQCKTREEAIERLKQYRPHRFISDWDGAAIQGGYWYREAKRIRAMAMSAEGEHVTLDHNDMWIFKD